MSLRRAGVRPFNASGYEILDDHIGRGEVVIWSTDPTAPRLGDSYLIECDGQPYDVRVEQLTRLKGGWSAKCRVEALAP